MMQIGNAGSDRLTGWKEIAAGFGKDERTVKRWETRRAMPVHRLPGPSGTTVFAFTAELDAWVRSRAADPADVESASTPADAPAPPRDTSRYYVLAGALAVIVAVLAGFGLPLLFPPATVPPARLVATAPPPAAATMGKAAELVLEGTYYWSRRTPDDLNRALQIFTNAIAEDPAYAPAYVGLANCYNLLREYTLMPAADAYPKARAAAERAIALDANLAEAHSSLAFGQFFWFWDSAAALGEIRRALELDPDSVQTRHWHATMLMYTGDYAGALAEISRAQELDPASRSILADKGLILYYLGRRDEAKTLLRQLAEAEPDYYAPASYLATIYYHERLYDDHFRLARAAAKLIDDDDALVLADIMSAAYAEGGEPAMFAAELAHRKARYAAGKLEAYWLARTYAYAGNAAEAIRLIETSIARHEQSALILRIDPAFEPLRTDPAFRTLVTRVGLPPLA